MTLEQIIKLTSNTGQSGELKTVEFKSSTADLKGACQTLCGFLNHEGGVVLIGVKNDGRLVGQIVTDRTRQDIANEIKKFEPSAPIKIDYIPFEGKTIIVFEVSAGLHIPYVYDGRPYQRIESITTLMSQHLYEQFLIKRGQLNHSWEAFPAKGVSVDDLDVEEIYRTVDDGIACGRLERSVVSKENISNILRGLDLLADRNITNAAVVLFAKKIPYSYSQCEIKMARFMGINKTKGFIDEKRYIGNAFRVLEEAETFVRRHLNIAMEFSSDSFERIDTPQLPFLAVREALINAICHRDYSHFSGSISLAIYDDRFEIWNMGELPAPLRLEDLTKTPHDSVQRNKKIAHVFYVRKYIEKWGSGITRMGDLCRDNQVPAPEYSLYSGGFSICFRFKNSLQQSIKPEEKNEFSKRQRQILSILEKFDELKLSEINDKLDKKIPERTLRADLSLLKEKGVISSQGRTRSTQWFLTKREK
jgi:ATP-dependent DNA helicase RecG